MITFIIKNKDVTTQHKLEYDKNIKFNDVINNLNLNEYKISIFGKNSIINRGILFVNNYDDFINEIYDMYIVNIIYDDVEINFYPFNKKFIGTMTFNEVIYNLFGDIDYSHRLIIMSSTGIRINNYNDRIDKYSDKYYISKPIR